MSTPNFITQPGFPLMILDDTDYEFPICPECGCWVEETEHGLGICTMCGKEVKVDECETRFDSDAYNWAVEPYEGVLDEFNADLTFLRVVLKGGYYRGVQTVVKVKEDPHELHNDDCRCYWDMCRSKAIRKFDAEKRKVARFLKRLKKMGFVELALVDVFSNGEAIYHYVN